MTKKNVAYVWGEAEQKAFDLMKYQFEVADILQHFQRDLPIILETDASDYAIAGVLSQKHEDGVHPVGFFLRKLRQYYLVSV